MRHFSSAIFATTLLCATTANADQLIRKGGEWRSIVTGATPEPQTIDMCFAEATQEQAMAKIASGQCSKKDIKFNGNLVSIDIVCNTMAMQGTATLSGDSAYTADFMMHINTGGTPKVMHVTSESKWIGACKPGEKAR